MFFGRDDELRKLRDRLEAANAPNRLIVVVGPSGSGKSSLLRAGLLAALGHDPRWHAAPATVIEPRSPLEALAVALEHVAAKIEQATTLAAPAIVERWTAEAVPVLMCAILRGTPDTRLLVPLDQFEQLYVAAPAERDRCPR